VHCPDDTGDLLDALSAQSVALTTAWAGMARRLGVPAGATESSNAHADTRPDPVNHLDGPS
jgi:hypothetical protein